ncbi:MAG: zinc ribbon domain-containing protein [Deltaproteobacteria bacterium]|nr:zinc ribbon domain-containing protein [Deltaproteobacteria bacterium]
MFLIAGISPKTTVLDMVPRRCSICGTSQAYLKRVDHFFSLFFIPLFRVKKGAPVIMCDNCMGRGLGNQGNNGSWRGWQKRSCQNCGKSLKGDFEYCPYCGRPV